MDAIGYLRVSTDEQFDSGLGLTAQHQALCDEAARRGWDFAPIQDVGSGRSMRPRSGLQRALGMLRAGEAQVLMVSKLDRLSRSVMDFASIVERSRTEGWALVILDLGVDTSTLNGKFVAGVMMQVAEWEREVIGQRTKAALSIARSKGIRLGRPVLLPAAIRERILADRLDGRSYRAIADALNAEGVPTAQGGREWYAATVRSVEQRAA